MARITVDSSKTTRKVVDAPDGHEGRVRASGDPEEPIELSDLPAAIGEVLGRQMATIRKLSRMGVRLDTDEIEQLGILSRVVGALITAQQKVKPTAEVTAEELERIANG